MRNVFRRAKRVAALKEEYGIDKMCIRDRVEDIRPLVQQIVPTYVYKKDGRTVKAERKD